MSERRKTSLARYRRRIKRLGLMRVEVRLRKEDAALVRGVAAALNDPERRAEARLLLLQRFAPPRVKGLKALLAAAPFEGIDLERSRDTGRTVEL